MEKQVISDFYDKFSERQIKIGANERLISLYKRLLKLGLTDHSNVLELGCGVGIFTRILSKKIMSGYIEAIDISEKSIDLAKKYITAKNVYLYVADVVNYKPKKTDFNFITLLDVIEHIPLQEHASLFKNLSEISSENTLIIINIPNPQYINYINQHHPQDLQIVDQPVELFRLIQHFEHENLEIIYFEKYSIWEQEDYHFMVIRKKKDFKLMHLQDQRSFFQKLKHRINIKINQIKFC